MLKLIAKAYLSLLCGDCGLPSTSAVPNYRPRESEHAVCDDCVKLYRNCVVCGEETRDRDSIACSYACFVKSNFPDNLTPALRVWFTIMNRFSVFDASGSVTRIAKLSGTNVPTAKRVVTRAGDMLERATGSDRITR